MHKVRSTAQYLTSFQTSSKFKPIRWQNLLHALLEQD